MRPAGIEMIPRISEVIARPDRLAVGVVGAAC
jgi:hypothetical protein